MVDSLYGLGHHGVVGCDDYYRKVGELCASGTHGSESLVSRSVEEGDAAAVGQLHVIGTDVLGYASRLAGNHVGLAYVVEQRGLAVVDMTHDGNYRRPRKQVFRPVHLLGAAYLLGDVRGDELDLVAELLRHEHERLGIEPLVYGHHETEAHAGTDDLDDRHVVHEGRKIVDGHELGNLEYLLLGSRLREFLLGTLGRSLALLLAVLRTEAVLLALVHLGIGLLDLLLDFLLELLLLGLRHGRLETVAVALTLALSRLGLRPATAVLLRRLLYIRSGLGYIHLLGSLVYALALLRRLAVELAEVYLAYDLERGSRRIGGSLPDGCGRLGRCLGSGFGFRLGSVFRSGAVCSTVSGLPGCRGLVLLIRHNRRLHLPGFTRRRRSIPVRRIFRLGRAF